MTLGMTGSFGGFMPGSMGGGSPFGSMQVGLPNNYIRKKKIDTGPATQPKVTPNNFSYICLSI